MRESDFPKTLYVNQTVEGDDGTSYLGNDELDGGASEPQDGDLVAVYELKEIRKMRVTRDLVDLEGR